MPTDRALEPRALALPLELAKRPVDVTYQDTVAKLRTSTWDFAPVTLKQIRSELLRADLGLIELWRAIRDGVDGLYTTSPARDGHGRLVHVEPTAIAAAFEAGMARYRTPRGERVRLASDEREPVRYPDRDIAGGLEFDVMHIGAETIETFRRLESARVFLNVAELRRDIARAEATLAASPWPAAYTLWKRELWPAVRTAHPLARKLSKRARKDATREERFANTMERTLTAKLRGQAWADFLNEGGRREAFAAYRRAEGQLHTWRSILAQLDRLQAPTGQPVELRTEYFKHATRRFQSVNVWPSEASSKTPTEPTEQPFGLVDVFSPQRNRWFRVRAAHPEPVHVPELTAAERAELGPLADVVIDGADSNLVELAGLDVSGSQAQILAVILGDRALEEQLSATAFKSVMADSIQRLHTAGEIVVPDDVLSDPERLENVGKLGMQRLYGAELRTLAFKMQDEPWHYGRGLDRTSLEVVFKNTDVTRAFSVWLDECQAVGEAATSGGLTVVDPLDGREFTWNPPKRKLKPVTYADFTLSCEPPVLDAGGRPVIDAARLARRVAPGLVQMADALYAALVVEQLYAAGVRDVVAVHDAFMVAADALPELAAAMDTAGALWLPRLGPIYDALERHLPARSKYGRLVRDWRATWEQRVRECRWPRFKTKPEGTEVRPTVRA